LKKPDYPPFEPGQWARTLWGQGIYRQGIDWGLVLEVRKGFMYDPVAKVRLLIPDGMRHLANAPFIEQCISTSKLLHFEPTEEQLAEYMLLQLEV
jgi:hypothetical protein